MNTLFALLLLPFVGELGWVNAPTHTCLYKQPNSVQMFFVELPKEQPCPIHVEIKDEPVTREKTRQARYVL